MSDRVCYIQRTDRGARLVRARLLGERSDESWLGSGGADAASAELAAIEAGDWIRARLAETRTPKRLDTLCLDVDGAACSWVKGRDADAELIRSAVEGAQISPEGEDALEPLQTHGVADRLPRLPLEVSYDLLAREEGQDPEGRVAVLAAPDAPARLLLDHIDALGVRIERVITLWHALAEAWDPGARAAPTESADIITTEHPPAAIAAIDHEGGRIVWVWSHRGSLLACGSIRLKRVRRENDTHEAEVHEHDIARLAADWLGWSAQSGVCPARVVVVGRPAASGMAAGEIGTALTRAWPGALTDINTCEDAVGETLRQTLDTRHIGSFHPLTERPTRVHRSAYRWSALTLCVVGLCLFVLAVLLFGRAGATNDRLETVRTDRTQMLNQIDPSLVFETFPTRVIEEEIAALERRTGRLDAENIRPVLQELETLSFVLAMPGITLTEIEVNDSIVTVRAALGSVAEAEQLDQALRGIGGTQLRWDGPTFTETGRGEQTVVNATYVARWAQQRTSP
ncbi:MAG: hypothetical protein LAT64_08940 [Phycisphaerales bacterium]|nr:hypothetical protein [Planctomycetota bacterium]MCH8508876.1 hypothetical protein [Phycisphaerales bacterium]